MTLQWDSSPDPNVVGYNIYYGVESQVYTNFVTADLSATATLSNLTPGLTYYISATSLNLAGLESPFSGEVAYQVGSPPCSIVVFDLVQPYDGTPKTVSVTTEPAGVIYLVTYAGLLDAPINPGTYAVNVIVADPPYATSDTEILTITPPVTGIQLDNLNQQYDGSPKTVLVTTDPPGLPTVVTYNGGFDAPVNAGTYTVAVTVEDPIYSATTSATLTISPANGFIQFWDLNQTFDGTPKQVSANSVPGGLNVTLTYNGQTQAPTASGTYSIFATIDDPNYVGSALALLTIGGVGPTAPLPPLFPPNQGGTQATTPSQRFVLSWANATPGVTIWQSSDLVMWAPLTNVTGSSSTAAIVPRQGTSFFRATINQPEGISCIPLSISLQQPAQPQNSP